MRMRGSDMKTSALRLKRSLPRWCPCTTLNQLVVHFTLRKLLIKTIPNSESLTVPYSHTGKVK